jgi:hybrid cluster-associated redox disulfide protein
MNSAEPESITATTTIDEAVARNPAIAQVFIRRRMHCVGCEVDRFHTVGEACRIYGQPLGSFLDELRQLARESRPPVSARANQHLQR